MSDAPPLASRLVLGAVAGFVATLPMTVAMRKLHGALPKKERYPAPPRELIDSATAEAVPEEPARDLTIVAHHLYGAAVGAMVAGALPRAGAVTGAAAGVAVWTGSYLGWIPSVGLLRPATDHPTRRNGMMIAAHLVWGAATALSYRELVRERESLFSGGPDKDMPAIRSGR
ncbi:MAG: hypothetical protein ACK4SZ_10365 [Allosphingosinicella sp.]|uniref:hypothetical protein n=1 Tax=Allosphingosinicella sp. TaxID=2823234 RepID=UPI00392059B2